MRIETALAKLGPKSADQLHQALLEMTDSEQREEVLRLIGDD